MNKRYRKPMSIAIVVLAILSPVLVMALYVEDWSRDLTTNVAWTDPEALDASLHPIEVVGDRDELQDRITAFTAARPNWSEPQPPGLLPEDSPINGMTLQPEGEVQFHLIRTTGIVQYKDDVWIIAEPIGREADDAIRWRLHLHSQSRVGKGDLGQNPRNLREVLTAMRDANE